MADEHPPEPEDTDAASSLTKKSKVAKAANAFIIVAAMFYAMAAIAMAAVSVSLIVISATRVYAAFPIIPTSERVLLDAVSSLVISVAILDVGKYVMEEEVLRSRELRKPNEAREAVTKFMVMIALVVSIESIVLVFELGKTNPTLLFYPTMLLFASVLIVIGLGVFLWLSLKAEEFLEKKKK